MKNKSPKASTSLIKRKLPNRQFIEFPVIKGRTLDKIELCTNPEHHALTLNFQDKTSLTLVIEPCFVISASFFDISSGDQRILKRWPTIQSMTNRA